MPKIIHVIGFVGSGKTWFISKFLRDFECFDIKDIYEEAGFEPGQLYNNPTAYAQFQGALEYKIDQLMNNLPDEWLVVESSGINRALNATLLKFLSYHIWVDQSIERIKEAGIYRSRPYAKSLNRVLAEKMQKGEITHDMVYSMEEQRFKSPLPPDLKKLFRA